MDFIYETPIIIGARRNCPWFYPAHRPGGYGQLLVIYLGAPDDKQHSEEERSAPFILLGRLLKNSLDGSAWLIAPNTLAR